MGNLRIYLTGRPAIETEDGPIEDIPDRLARLAFAYLVLQRHRPVPLAEIADAHWEGDRPLDWNEKLEAALATLEATIERLDTQEIALERDNDLVRLQLPSEVWVDLEYARRSLEHAEVALKNDDLSKALTRSTAASVIGSRPFLPEIESGWADTLRTRLESDFIDGLILRTKTALRLGAAEEAVRLARQTLSHDPMNEPAVRTLMRAMDAAGNRVGALQVYEAYRTSAAASFAAEPTGETQRLAAELRSAPPAEVDVLTPREREVAHLLAEGLTNRQIADKLFISVLTAETHVKHILTKLSLSSRSQVAAWAATRSLNEPSDT